MLLSPMKKVDHQSEWRQVIPELEGEELKVRLYDKIMLDHLGDVQNAEVLDYGCGPGILLDAMQRLGAKVKGFDISAEMREQCAARIGSDKVYDAVEQIRDESFDIIICNLVLCVVNDGEVRRIVRNIRNAMRKDGKALIGFCNPLIFDVPESQLDYRFPTGDDYRTNHRYRKKKKEGGYEITEEHRPIKWYEREYRSVGLRQVNTLFTPEYELNGRTIRDFVIFEHARE